MSFESVREQFELPRTPIQDVGYTCSAYLNKRKISQKMNTTKAASTHVKYPLKVALISTPLLTVPPKNYGGLELIVANLGKYLAKLGHNVTIFAPNGSKIDGCHIVETGEPKTPVFMDWLKQETNMYEKIKDKLDGFDIIHSHNWFAPEYQAKQQNPEYRICHTHHGGILANWMKNRPFKLNNIAISDYMKTIYEKQGIPSKRVHNGVDISQFPMQQEKSDRYLWFSRMAFFKAPHKAIEIANRTGIKLDLAGATCFTEDQKYIQQLKKECNGNQIRFIGQVTNKEKIELLQNAKALIVTGKWCVLPDHDVLTEQGIKDISEVDVNDIVYSHDGTWHRVTEKTQREYSGDVIEITPYGINLPLSLTENHRIYSARRVQTRTNRPFPSAVKLNLTIHVDEPQWICCNHLKEDDFIVIPIQKSQTNIETINLNDYLDANTFKVENGKMFPTSNGNGINSNLKLTDDVMRMFGYYVAEGSATNSEVRFNFGTDDDELVNDCRKTLCSIGWKNTKYEGCHGCNPVVAHSVLLRKLFTKFFGRHAENKSIPRWIMKLPEHLIRSFVEGLWKGDGCNYIANGFLYYEYSTVSKALALQLFILLLKLGINPQLFIHTQSTKSYGKKPIYRLKITGKHVSIMTDILHEKTRGKERKIYWQKGFFHNDKLYLPIRKMEKRHYQGTVYNLEVEETQSFLCEGIIIHNSEPFGLHIIEAMACGTGVLAIADGGIRETVRTGGILCEDHYELADAIKHYKPINPKVCRQNASIFSAKKMSKAYIQKYYEILDGDEW